MQNRECAILDIASPKTVSMILKVTFLKVELLGAASGRAPNVPRFYQTLVAHSHRSVSKTLRAAHSHSEQSEYRRCRLIDERCVGDVARVLQRCWNS